MRLILAFLILGPTIGVAQDSIRVPENARFLVHIDINAFRKTELGGKLFEMARHEAIKELHDGREDHAEKVREALGFDPFTELDAVTVVGSDFENAEEHVQLVLRLRKTSGNLEGLMATLPGYGSSDYGRHTIHWASPDANDKAYGAIHTDKKGMKRVVAARTADEVRGLLDMLDGKSRRGGRSVKLTGEDGAFVHVQLLEIPHKEIGDGPHANVAKLLQGVAVRIGDNDGDLSVEVTLTTEKEEQAQQIQQMVQGLVAMVQLVQEDDDDLKRAQEILRHVKIRQKDNTVRLRLAVPEQQIIDLIEDEMNLSLSI